MRTQVRVDLQLKGFWQTAARLAWIAAFMLSVGLWTIGSFELASRPPASCADVACDPFSLAAEDIKVIEELGLPTGLIRAFFLATNMSFAIAFFVVALVIFWRAPDARLGMAVSFMLVYFGAAFFTSSDDALWQARPDLRGLLAVVYGLGYIALILFLFYFPDGQFAPRSRRLQAVAVPLVLLTAPFTVNAARADPLAVGLFLGFVGAGVAAQIHRYRRVSGPSQRQQTKWVMFGLMGAVLVMLIWIFTAITYPAGQSSPERIYFLIFVRLLITVLIPLLPLTIAFSILRHRLFDIDLIINRTLVYGAMTVGVAALYVLVIGGLGLLFQSSGNLLLPLLATGLAAVLFQPVRQRLQGAVNRLMYGERDEPAALLARLGEHLEQTGSPETALTGIVETVAQALKLPYAAIELGEEGEIAAAYGLPINALQWFPLIYQGETVGQMLVAERAPGEALTPKDRRLLETIARQAGAAAHAVRLTAELRRSRQRLVTAREEERRRLRRDLHDGLGPRLASLTLKLDAARNLLPHDPTATEALLSDLKADAQAAITAIRRLVYGLRPPALDELGLVGALREHVVTQNMPDGLHITVEAPDELPPLPAAVEVAAYRIALEALTNVARHAQARECLVRFTLDNALHLEITDDGVGLPSGRSVGVGLASMRERAAELGGACVVETRPEGGTLVRAELPIGRAS